MSPSTKNTAMKSAASYRRGTGFATKWSRRERQLLHAPHINSNRAHKLGTGKQRTADKHKVKKQRIADRYRKFSEQQPFAEAETPTNETPTNETPGQAWEEHLLLLASERLARSDQ
jgi:hypothetical protein